MDLYNKIFDSVQGSVKMSAKGDFFMHFQDQVIQGVRLIGYRDIMFSVDEALGVTPKIRRRPMNAMVLRKIDDYEFSR